MRKCLILVVLFACNFAIAQRSVLDSIKQQVKLHAQEDTARAFFLNELAWQYLDYSTDSAGIYCKEAMKLSQQLNYTDGIITAKNIEGLLYRIGNQLEEAIKAGREVVALRVKYGPESRLTGAYSNLGAVYLVKGDNAKALNYFNKALENAQVHKQLENQVLILTNMGIVYGNSELNDLALEAYRKAVVINKQLDDDVQQAQLAQLYLNIAPIYDKRGLHKEAYKYYKYSYELYKKENNLRQLSVVVYNLTSTTRNINDMKGCEYFIKEMEGIARQLNEDDYTASLHLTKANYFLAVQKYQNALSEVNEGLSLIDTTESFLTYAVLLGIKSDCYKYLKDYKKSLEYSIKGLSVVKRTDNKSEIISLYNGMAEVYELMKDYKMALMYFNKAVQLRDSLNTELFDTRVATLNSFNQLDKKEKELELSNKEKEKVSIENKRQATLLVAGTIVGFLVLILLVFSLRAYRVKQKDNVMLSEQKQEIEHQKDIVEEKQKEIVDSINYALQIQKTLIANHDFVNQTVPDSFVFFQPKDIVSGDFYWATKKDKRFYLAVCDSTGHGVPGAFMSLLNINYLNEAIKEKNISKPNEVFDHARQRLIETISQNGRQDGMDGILICIEEGSDTIHYAAANNAPIVISDNRLMELKADKMPVGVGERKEPFMSYSFKVKKGDLVYLYTDGFADQFGGPKGKKFKYKQLEELLLNIHSLPVKAQEETLKQKFMEWKGGLDQIDDVCVLGIRV
jgi:serine phosphatase RsbU (regulator of sigma subunit)